MSSTQASSGSPQSSATEAEVAYQSGDRTLEWLCHQPGSFFRPYAGKWIAAKDCRILASADNHRELMAQLSGVDLRATIIHRIERPGKVIYR